MSDNDEGKIGYGRPPAEHRWKPGQSGNPKGRPKGKKKAVPSPDLPDSSNVLLAEANREVQVSGESISATKALFRSQLIGGIKGNRLMAKDMADRIERAEREAREARTKQFEEVSVLKEQLRRRFKEARDAGLPEPDFRPHPDDIKLDRSTGSWSIEGPWDSDEKKQWDEMLAELDKLRRQVFYYRGRVAKDPTNPNLTITLIELGMLFEEYNGKLPERYKRKRIPIWRAGRTLPMPDWTMSESSTTNTCEQLS